MVAEMESDDDQDMSGGQRHHGRPRGQHQSPRPTGASSAPPPAKPKMEFLPNVVIHLKLATPNEDKRKIVADLRVIPHVAFVDVTSPTDVFIRVDAEAGVGGVKEALFLKQSDATLRLLEGEEEQRYWGKIQEDMERRSANSKTNKARGQAKVRGDTDVSFAFSFLKPRVLWTFLGSKSSIKLQNKISSKLCIKTMSKFAVFQSINFESLRTFFRKIRIPLNNKSVKASSLHQISY